MKPVDTPETDRPTLSVVIGCDCDPDRPQYGGERYDSRSCLTWRGIHEGIPRLRDQLSEITDDYDNPVRITWCVRSDLQMKDIYGDCAWPYSRFEHIWSEQIGAGDEIAWHCHLWRWSESDSCWYQEVEEPDWIRRCLHQGYQALSAQMQPAPRVSRMGWEFHNNYTMQTLDRLGIRADFSAIPGRFTQGRSDNLGTSFHGHVDWRDTPAQPYRPSSKDYRRPAFRDESSLGVIELPMSTFRSRMLGLIAHIRNVTRSGGVTGICRLLDVRSINADVLKAYITIHPFVFSRLADHQLKKATKEGAALLVTAFHPDEMLQQRGGGPVLYSLRHMTTNLRSLQDRASKRGVLVRFLTPFQILKQHSANTFARSSTNANGGPV